MERKEFLDTVKAIFGDKVIVKQLEISADDAEKLKMSAEDINAYPAQAWIPEKDGMYRCPYCDAALGGLFSSFEWGFVHGIGFCSKCGKVEFRYYHYVTERDKAKHGQCRRLELFAVCGLSDKLAQSEA